jgi:hypothetical protein
LLHDRRNNGLRQHLCVFLLHQSLDVFAVNLHAHSVDKNGIQPVSTGGGIIINSKSCLAGLTEKVKCGLLK